MNDSHTVIVCIYIEITKAHCTSMYGTCFCLLFSCSLEYLRGQLPGTMSLSSLPQSIPFAILLLPFSCTFLHLLNHKNMIIYSIFAQKFDNHVNSKSRSLKRGGVPGIPGISSAKIFLVHRLEITSCLTST